MGFKTTLNCLPRNKRKMAERNPWDNDGDLDEPDEEDEEKAEDVCCSIAVRVFLDVCVASPGHNVN